METEQSSKHKALASVKESAKEVTHNRCFLAVCLSASLMIGCASVEKDTADTVSDSAASTTQAEAQQASQGEAKQDEVAQAANEADAEAMIASLAQKAEEEAPKQVEQKVEPVVEKVASVLKQEVPKPAAEVVAEEKVAVQSKPVEAEINTAAQTAPALPATPAPAAPEAKTETIVNNQPAPKVKAAVTSKASKGKALKASMKDLPIEHDIWVIRRGETELEKNVVVSSLTWGMGEPGVSSQIWLSLMDDKILVNSTSVIYEVKGKAGIRINGGDLIPFNRILSKNIDMAVIEGDWLSKLAEGGTLSIHMGFFPDRQPKSKMFKSSVSLDALDRVVPTYQKLTK